MGGSGKVGKTPVMEFVFKGVPPQGTDSMTDLLQTFR